MSKFSLFDMNFTEIIEDTFGVSPQRLRELAEADREGRCVVLERAKLEDIPFTYESLSKIETVLPKSDAKDESLEADHD